MSMAMPSVRKTSLVIWVAPPELPGRALRQLQHRRAPSGLAPEEAPMLLATDVAVTLAVRAPSTCVTCTGALTSATLAIELSGTMP